jgi:hypothetical protein
VKKMSKIVRFILIVIFLGMITYCSKIEDDSRSDSLLSIDKITAKSTNGDTGSILYSDVIYKCSIINDVADVQFSNDYLNFGSKPSFLNDIVLIRYRVTYKRPDNRNQPGVDVPYPFDEAMDIKVPVNGQASTGITVVRAAAKMEKPLYDLRFEGQEKVISTIAELEFWGHDLAGRNVYTKGYLEVLFANWADE